MSLFDFPPLHWQIKSGLQWPPQKDTIHSVLIIHLEPLGDFVIMSPFLRNLRALYPTAKITLAVQPAVAQLAQACPYIDAIEVANNIARYGDPYDLREHMALGMQLQASQFAPFDLCIIPRYDHDHLQANAVADHISAQYTIGYGRETSAFKANVTHTSYDASFSALALAPNGFHDVQYQLALLKALGATIADDQPLELWANSEDGAQAEIVLNTFKFTPNQYVVFGIGSSQISKIWGIENFCELGARIFDTYGLKILVLGGTDYEIEASSQLVAYLGVDKAQSTVSRISSRASFLLTAASRMAITLDTFLAHAAAAAKKPVTVIYSSPADCPLNDMFHPSRIHPWQTVYNAIQPNTCGPIDQILANHIRSPHCVNKITVDDVWAQVQVIMPIL